MVREDFPETPVPGFCEGGARVRGPPDQRLVFWVTFEVGGGIASYCTRVYGRGREESVLVLGFRSVERSVARLLGLVTPSKGSTRGGTGGENRHKVYTTYTWFHDGLLLFLLELMRIQDGDILFTEGRTFCKTNIEGSGGPNTPSYGALASGV